MESAEDFEFVEAVMFALTVDHRTAFRELSSDPRFTAINSFHDERRIAPLSPRRLVAFALCQEPLPLACIQILVEVGAEVCVTVA
jgi:hypothetical protein